MDQREFAQRIEQKSKLEIQRLRIMFDDMFYISNNEKKLKPDVTMDQLLAIKDSLIKALAIYNDRNREEEALKQENTEFDNNITQTRDKLLSFSKQFNVKIPSVFAKLYGIE